MYDIEKNIYLIIVSILVGCLFICFCVFDGNIERISIVLITLILISIIKKSFLNTRTILIFFFSFIFSIIISSFVLYYYVINYKEVYIKEYDMDEEQYIEPAVVLLCEGEYPTYKPIMILKELYSESSFKQKVEAPFKVFNKKLAYEDLGRSKYNDICKDMSEELQLRLGRDYHVFLTFLKSNPNFYKEIQEIKKSYDKIIIVPLFLSKNKEYEEVIERISNNSFKYEGDIKFTPLLWNSDKLAKQITRQVMNINNENDISLTGIIVVETKKFTNKKDQNIFYKRVTSKLEDYGLSINKVTVLDGDITKDGMKNSVHRLQETGVNNIIVISLSNIMDNIEKKHKIKKVILDISKEELISISYIDGWGLGEYILNELEYKIRLANLK